MKTKKMSSFWVLFAIFWILLIYPVQGGEDDSLAQMMSRIESQSGLKGKKALYFQKLTPLLFDYLQIISTRETLDSLYQAQSLQELGLLIEQQMGNNIIDFGEKMFAYFEKEASKDTKVNTKEWSPFLSDHFIFYAHPGSRAEAEIDSIKESAESTYTSVAAVLGIEEEVERTAAVLHTDLIEENKKKSCPGKIVAYLHQKRRGKTEKKIGKHSMGNMSFGATILKSGENKGWGRLTAEINVLYFNAFSLTVLHHEIAHAVLFLGSFDLRPLNEKPLKGKSDLKKAFFAGYTAISPFLHEGIGDYALYYHGFYQHWPILPPPEELVKRIISTERYISLSTLIKEGVRFRSRHHKEYSLEAAVFLNYLHQNYEKVKLKQWFLTGKKDSHSTFKNIYGKTIQNTEKEWHAHLQGFR